MAAAQRNGDSNDGGGVINSIPQSTVFAEKIAINRTGDADTCEHTRAGGSDDVFVG